MENQQMLQIRAPPLMRCCEPFTIIPFSEGQRVPLRSVVLLLNIIMSEIETSSFPV